MKKYYELTGMSCGGCVNSVKQALMELPDVTEAEVQLKPQGVLLTMNESIDTNVLQAQLDKAGHYTILIIVYSIQMIYENKYFNNCRNCIDTWLFNMSK